MSYIGRGTDKISNVEKLDNISFSGSTATFNLTKGGSAFIPSSAECIRLAIDGVEQGNNYTVSGSQITFDFTPSGSSTNNWIYHIGVGVITTPADGSVTEAKIGSSAVTTAKINDGAVTSGKIASGVVPTLRPNAKPIIINGDMQVAQRGTSVSSLTSSGAIQTVDRIKNEIGNIGTYTVAQESLSSGEAYNNGFRKAWRIDTTTADASPSAGDSLYVTYSFEGQDLQLFKKGTSNAQKFTLAFWIKSNKTGTGQVNLRDNDNSRLIGGTYTISSADTWEHKVVNFAADTTGAFDNDNAGSMDIEWWLDSGTTYSSGATPTSWESFSQADRNAGGTLQIARNTANDWSITGIQLEVGEFSSTTLPPFQHESFGDNLRRCQRYFQMRAEGNQKIISIAHWGSGSEVDFVMHIPFMRTRPSLEYTTGNEYWAIGGGGSTNTLDNLNMNSWSTEMNINLWTTTGAGGTTGFAYYGYSNNASAKLGFTAEL